MILQNSRVFIMKNKKIKFFDVQKINQKYKENFKNRFESFLNSEKIILGEKTEEFESKFSIYCGSKYSLGISNGLDALKLILIAYIEMGIFAKGDEIIVPANTYIASILSISESGLKPVLVDADINTYNIDFHKIESKITSKTKGIMIVHLYGQIVFSNILSELAKKYNLKIIEDSAQAHGATYHGIKAGCLGDASGFSFYPTKNLGALGEAGAITTNDIELFKVIKDLRNYGSEKRYFNKYKGYNCRIDELQSSFLIAKLKNLDRDNEIRRKNAEYLSNNINNPEIILPKCINNKDSHVWHLYVVRIDAREDFAEYLESKNIQTIVHYPIPPHKQAAYNEFKNDSFPVSELIHKTVLSLPSNIHLKQSELDYIIDICNEF